MILVFSPGCGIFESTTTDPHPPTIFNLKVAPRVVHAGDLISGSFSWFDAGADIETVSMRDRNSNANWTPQPPPTANGEEGEEDTGIFVFLGTSGTTFFTAEVTSTQPGRHNIVIWVEDSKGSRSDQLQFAITIAL